MSPRFGPKGWSPRDEHPVDLSKWFNVENLWNRVASERSRKKFQDLLEDVRGTGGAASWWLENIGSGAAGVYQAGEVIRFFGIPHGDVHQYEERRDVYGPEVWDAVILPFADKVAKALNRRKPEGIAGWMEFGWSEADNTFGLKYLEMPAE